MKELKDNIAGLRDKYIEMRKSGQYEFEWFYKFYIKSFEILSKGMVGAFQIPYELFIQAFQIYFPRQNKEVLDYLDKLLEVRTLSDINNNIIKIVG